MEAQTRPPVRDERNDDVTLGLEPAQA